MVQYGTLDFEHPVYNTPPVVRPAADNELVEQFLERIQPGDIRLSSPPPKDWDFCTAVLTTGRHREFIGSDERMLLARNLKAAKKLPPIWFCQGEEDEIVRVYQGTASSRRLTVSPDAPPSRQGFCSFAA